jgi:hypothetical protein
MWNLEIRQYHLRVLGTLKKSEGGNTMRKLAFAIGCAITVLGATVPAVSAAAATPGAVHPMDPPNCNPGVSGSPGVNSFTLHVTGNPCSDPIKAYVTCVFMGGIGGPSYGPAVTLGSSKAECGFGAVYEYGYSIEYAPGSWSNITMGYRQ